MRWVALEVVFLDIGGVMYRDKGYRDALRRALRELGGTFSEGEFEAEYDACRAAQSGSFRARLTRRFLGPGADVAEVERHAERWWRYAEEDLEPDVVPTLERLRAIYRLGIIANQPSVVREAMARDGLDRFFDVWAVSADVGFDKPDPRLFAHAVAEAGVESAAAAMVGDRLDYDVRPAREAGMHAVWMLRGEAPDEPSPEQLAEADASIRRLDELPDALDAM
jgi:HAD superfamily hydrolase (TIGR01549 family)